MAGATKNTMYPATPQRIPCCQIDLFPESDFCETTMATNTKIANPIAVNIFVRSV